MRWVVALVCLPFAFLPAVAAGESIKVATWNIENFHAMFEAHRMEKSAPATRPVKELVDEERRQNMEDQWEVSLVIRDADFDPDILVIQEGCRQSDLEYFNRRWLEGSYKTVLVFPTNTDRDQHLGILMKPGFELLEVKSFHTEKDAVPNDRGDRLFARGPSFVKVKSPSGYTFWVGTTHQKSKADNSVAVTEWRNREAKRTHEIMQDLAKGGPDDLVLLGDMNDELGEQEFEREAGGSAADLLVGKPEDGFVLATKPLLDAREFTFGGYWRTDRRTLIDHVIVSPGLKGQIEGVAVFKEPVAQVASDHYPVSVTIRAE